ncbi:c-type cytochrome biogenesis protein CcmI, partial [Aquibium sp. A9E412]|uniref:c-type cytochrome biogenesis protein CcmI n=1 Tax=Aquibium sp. A9E412 TaxID=2976767 RepID=UPI0025B0DA3E
MLFWILAALLTLAASLAVLLPFLRRPEAEADADDPAEHDIEVYRDQLAELERDAERGLIGAEQAREARAEIGRRILRAGDQGTRAAAPRHSRAARLGGAAAVLAVPLVAWGVYAVVGSPGLPGQPLQARLAQDPAQASLEELVARAEAHLADNPQDGRGWDVLAPVYMRMGRYPQAVTAYRNAMRLSGASAVREAGLGEAIAAEAGGIVSAEAEDAFERALELDPTLTKARFFLATARAQDGRMAEAAEMWRSLRADLPEGSPWRGAVDRALAQLSGEGPGPAIAEAPAEGPGPTRAEIEAAGAMSDEDRAAMVEGMVSRLDARLREAPDDPAGWQRLVRSYAVLGRAEAA